jgi:hypothetical protein
MRFSLTFHSSLPSASPILSRASPGIERGQPNEAHECLPTAPEGRTVVHGDPGFLKEEDVRFAQDASVALTGSGDMRSMSATHIGSARSPY